MRRQAGGKGQKVFALGTCGGNPATDCHSYMELHIGLSSIRRTDEAAYHLFGW